MSVYQGTNLIAGGRQCMPLLSFMWADHELNDISWLRADTFSWQSGSVYVAAYSHLTDDITGKSLQSETVAGTTVQFYLADDGHKICPASEESNVIAIYAATGVAWYYILDTVNQRFKLPRTQFGVTGLRDTVGKYVEAGLPNINGELRYTVTLTDVSGAFTSRTGGGANKWGSGEWGNCNFAVLDASRSSSIYGNSTTVQPKATQMYLYFYVGSFTQTALENTAGITAETLNDKVDIGHQVIAFQEPTSSNNYTWYRKYADGWVEQGGRNINWPNPQSGGTANITFPIPMRIDGSTVEYTLVGAIHPGNATATYEHFNFTNRTSTGFSFTIYDGYSGSWACFGMAA